MELIMACLLLVSFYLLSRQAAVISVNLNTEQKSVLIDPGHGESDPGMIGIDGLEEKGINLSISLFLKEKLENRGYKVIMTRETDKGLYDEAAENKKVQDLQRRVAMIGEKRPTVSVSIHQNSYQDPSVYGPQVFYYESSVEGKRLAQALQDSLNEKLEVERPRMVKGNTSYYLLKRSPGILVIAECGFLTNPDEAKKLQSELYQDKVAEAIADGIDKYLEASIEKNSDGIM